MKFDLAAYTDRVAPVEVDDLDLDRFRTDPLDPATLRCLRYMHDVEQHTVCYLRDLLVTSAHEDPDVTTFLTFWNYEEHWHGRAIAGVLERHGEDAGSARTAAMRARLGWRNRVSPIVSMAASAALRDVTALHMSWGAVNEWTTQAGYARLSAKSGHPVLRELLQRIMRQEGWHIDFYASQAADRLARSAAAQRVTRAALRHVWRPVGSSVMPRTERDFLVRHLFDDRDGRAAAARIDRRIDRLPGLEGLGIVQRAVTAAAA